MKKIQYFAMAMAAMSLVACNNDENDIPSMNNDVKGAPIEVSFDVETPMTRSNFEGLVGGDGNAATNPWIQGDKVRLFITDHTQAVANNFVAYDGAIALNRELMYDAAKKGWTYSDQKDPATLSNVKARLYAYSPSLTTPGTAYYNGDATLNPNVCPIEFNTPNKIDFLYGTHRNTLNGSTTIPGINADDNGGSTEATGTDKDYIDNQSNKVRMYMKHAQAYVEVRLLKNDTDPSKKYSGKGEVTKVEIMGLSRTTNAYGKNDWVPAADPKLPSKGTVNVTKEGEVTVTETAILPMTDFSFPFLLNPTVTAGTANPTTAFALVCPTEASKVRGFHIVVDGKDFYIDAADVKFNDQRHIESIREIEWKAGYKYIYNFNLTGKGLELVPDPDQPSSDGDVDGDGVSDFIVVKPWHAGENLSQDF